MTWRDRVPGSVVRFLLAGATTTVITLVLYVLLLSFVSYAAAYTVAFIVGIVIAYLLNSTFVFRAGTSALTLALYPFIYGVQYLAGLAVVAVWVDVLELPATLASLAAIAVTLPLTYVMTRALFAWRGSSSDRRL